jgi:3,4-dihydroxyphenylacetate 2,3-dioxygenase
MLPEYAAKGHGEGFMHDTAMLLGVLGWDRYQGQAEVVTPYFPSSGTGQINVVFPVTPVNDEAGQSLQSLNLKSLKDPAAVYAAGASRL